MKLHINYMVSLRCKMAVQAALEKMGIVYRGLELGEVDIDKITPELRNRLRLELLVVGLELMDDKKAELIEKIKNVVVEMVHYADDLPRIKYSDYISDKLHKDYTYLANTFSEVTGITITHFIIKHKIEKAKELILYDQVPLKDIAYKLGYSSVAHLSTQFKKVTGLTPGYFKQLQEYRRRNTLESM